MKRRRRGQLAVAFIANYPTRLRSLEKLAGAAEDAVRQALLPLNLELHLINSRPKNRNSTIAKIRRKHYGNPARQVTDLVGVRVIVYYAEDVDRVAQALRAFFEVDDRRSVDKRRELQIRQFGYRSVHLVARFGSNPRHLLPDDLGSIWFEVQIRSVLEHAWAEIEHEICYKSGVRFPEALLRRFGALAGALEILDAQFTSLRDAGDHLINDLRTLYTGGQDLDLPLDTARLVAFLEVQRPSAPGWRMRDGDKRRFRPGTAAACVDALASARIRTPRQLRRALNNRRCRALLTRFAAANRVAPDEVSHLALSILVVASLRPAILAQFPDLLADTSLTAVAPVPAAV